MDVVIKILQFIASFSLLVFVHEMGHFIFAKIFGMRVNKFYLFFNPWFSLVKFKIGETEFGIGWIPFGGYCSIAGMVDETMDTEALSKPAQPWEFRSKPAWQRLLVMLGGVLMNVVLAIFIYIGMSLHYGESYIANKDLEYGWQFSELAHEIGFRDGDRIIDIDGKVYEKSQDVIKKIILSNGAEVGILRNGQALNINIPEDYTARKLRDSVFMLERIPFLVAEVPADGGAAAAGILAGDSIAAVNGEEGSYFQLAEKLLRAAGTTADVTVARDSAGTKVFRTLPVAINDKGQMGVKTQLPVTIKDYNFFQSIPVGIKRTGSEIAEYAGQVKLIFNPKTEAYKNLGGPLLIGNLFPSTWSWPEFWRLTAFLSIVLAVMNILPIPALDGGHVLFLLYEMITRRKPSDKFMEFAQMLGLFILLGLMIYVMGNDIYRIFIK